MRTFFAYDSIQYCCCISHDLDTMSTFAFRICHRGAWASQVKSREKALEKLMASDDFVKQPPNLGKPFRFRFPPAPRIGVSEELVSAAGVGHGYNGRTLFENVNLGVDKGERIAFLGPNGAGKSTLLRLVVGQEIPTQGACTLGSSVVKQYFEQNQADVLDLSKTVIDTLMAASTTEKYEDLRKLLGQFLFKGDAVEKSVEQLSGGEKARVALCKMMLTPANLLVLDEPTNHLDIPAKEMLEEALQHYEGSVPVVSHDRYFVSQVSLSAHEHDALTETEITGEYRVATYGCCITASSPPSMGPDTLVLFIILSMYQVCMAATDDKARACCKIYVA